MWRFGPCRPGLFILHPPASQTLARKHGRTVVAPNIVHGDPTAVRYSSSPSLQAMDRKPKAVRKKKARLRIQGPFACDSPRTA